MARLGLVGVLIAASLTVTATAVLAQPAEPAQVQPADALSCEITRASHSAWDQGLP